VAMGNILKTSVADPDHFDADPDPTSEKTGSGQMMRILADPDPQHCLKLSLPQLFFV
jgi:hypothetical protein